jgi:ABC-type uncharacterized transport system ATPase subunit
MTALLQVQRVSKSFGSFTAVDQVSLQVDEGTVHGLIGPNGAGKSTLLSLICGSQLVDRGEVRLDGRRLGRLPDHRRVRLGLGVKFQLTRVLPDLTVLDNLRIAMPTGRHARRVRGGRVTLEEALDIVDLADQRHTVARELSHGQRKWLEIGAVLLAAPDVLILDEPTSAMSPAETERCARLIRQLRDGGRVRAVVLVEHDTRFIAALCDRITVLHHGRVLAEGTFAELEASADVRAAYLGGIDAHPH